MKMVLFDFGTSNWSEVDNSPPSKTGIAYWFLVTRVALSTGRHDVI